jgi:hypothetical protein
MINDFKELYLNPKKDKNPSLVKVNIVNKTIVKIIIKSINVSISKI